MKWLSLSILLLAFVNCKTTGDQKAGSDKDKNAAMAMPDSMVMPVSAGDTIVFTTPEADTTTTDGGGIASNTCHQVLSCAEVGNNCQDACKKLGWSGCSCTSISGKDNTVDQNGKKIPPGCYCGKFK